VGGLDVAQRAGSVIDERDWLAGSNHRLEQPDRVLILSQIPHRAMAAGVEDGVEVLGLDAVEAKCCRELRFRIRVGFEPVRKVGLKVWLVALRIERRLAALRRGKHDLGAGFLERVVGSSELLEPETRFYGRCCRACRARSEPSRSS